MIQVCRLYISIHLFLSPVASRLSVTAMTAARLVDHSLMINQGAISLIVISSRLTSIRKVKPDLLVTVKLI